MKKFTAAIKRTNEKKYIITVFESKKKKEDHSNVNKPNNKMNYVQCACQN